MVVTWLPRFQPSHLLLFPSSYWATVGRVHPGASPCGLCADWLRPGFHLLEVLTETRGLGPLEPLAAGQPGPPLREPWSGLPKPWLLASGRGCNESAPGRTASRGAMQTGVRFLEQSLWGHAEQSQPRGRDGGRLLLGPGRRCQAEMLDIGRRNTCENRLGNGIFRTRD